MSDINKYMFGDFEEFDNDGENSFRKFEELLSRMLDKKNLDDEYNDEEDIENEPTEKHVEVITKGDWIITITTYKLISGITTEKIELKGPSKNIPQEIQDFIKDRVSSKRKDISIGNMDNNIDAMIDDIFNKNTEDDVLLDIDEIAKFWYINKTPNFDNIINKALKKEDYEKAAYIRDKKESLEIFNQVTLDRLAESIANKDFVAIDTIISAYKAKLPNIIKL